MSNPPSRERSERDVRLDFFRGLAMFIIFIAHIPANPWGRYIPAKFGPSDATEIFVFCSGFASALAFGSIFIKKGFFLGAARIVYRAWQIYWAHICLFLMTASVVVLGTEFIGIKDYVGRLNLHPFFDDPASGIVHLLTLTYVPNYFDILPMYFGVLMMIPIMMALSRVHVGLAIGFSLALWAVNMTFSFGLPAEWWSDRPWFFNPFGWQLIFFTGFAFASGWIKPPAPNKWLIGLALVFVLSMIPMKYGPIWKNVEVINTISYNLLWGFQKTDFGMLRWVHFLALAYLVLCLLSGRERLLRAAVFKPIVKVGQQALAVFVTSMVAAQVAGMVLDAMGRDPLDFLVVHLVGFALLIAVAYTVGFFKSAPWHRARPQPPRLQVAPAPIQAGEPVADAAKPEPTAKPLAPQTAPLVPAARRRQHQRR
ncbi:MAG: OpgC domain-containing protein [Kiloniellales bacterium]|nr:OpgC domain-containing protein [Kiloniellales bacterium]